MPFHNYPKEGDIVFSFDIHDQGLAVVLETMHKFRGSYAICRVEDDTRTFNLRYLRTLSYSMPLPE